MKRLHRRPLSPEAQTFLGGRTDAVAQAADPRAEAARLWSFPKNWAFQEVQLVLRQMASGLERCMYCEDGAGTDIEHFWPKAVYPERAFDWTNYLLACSFCNSNSKREQFPLDEDGLPLLIDPTDEEPFDHLSLSPKTGRFISRTSKGERSIQVFGLGRKILEDGRKNAWIALQGLLLHYARLYQAGDTEEAQRVESAVREHPFAGVLAAFLRIAQGPDPDLLIPGDCLAALRQHPEILSWGDPA